MAKQKVLEAARKVLRLSPDAGRYWLSALSNPSHPEAMQGEDDLSVFADDPDFVELVGQEPYLMRGSVQLPQ